MKLRLRLDKTTKIVQIDNDATLEQLRSTVIDTFHINEFDLSLNGIDILRADESPLSAHGIVSGDLVRVLCSEHPAAAADKAVQNATDTEHTAPCVRGEQATAASASSMASCSHQEAMQVDSSASTAASEEDKDCIQDHEVNRYLLEPMLIRDSTSTQVPQTLQLAWRASRPQNEHQAVLVVLHVLMTEVGFHQTGKLANQAAYILASDWNTTGSFKVEYQHCSCHQAFTILAVPMGPLIVVHGSVNEEKPEVVCQLQLKSKDYVADLKNESAVGAFKDLSKLSRVFKDNIAYPILQKAKLDSGSVADNSWLGLITELKLSIMTLLDMKSLLSLSQTCLEMLDLAKEPALWRRLYLRDFGRFRNGENELAQDWQKLYKEKYIQRARYRQAMRNITIVTPPFIGRPAPPLPFGPIYPPGFLGGDYDRGPNFGGMPGPLGPLPGMFGPVPFQPRFDPFGPLPGQNFRPGWGGGLWEEEGGLGGVPQRMPNSHGGRLGGRGGMGGFGHFRMF